MSVGPLELMVVDGKLCIGAVPDQTLMSRDALGRTEGVQASVTFTASNKTVTYRIDGVTDTGVLELSHPHVEVRHG